MQVFEIGAYIVYGDNGVCQVEKIGGLQLAGADKEKLYYTLRPYYDKERVIYTPVDNLRVTMREIITKEEARHLIDEISTIEVLQDKGKKQSEEEYKEIVRKCDCRELVKVIKTIYFRKQKRLKEGKKVISLDERYFKIAEDNLYGELGVVFQVEKRKIKDVVIGQLKERKKEEKN